MSSNISLNLSNLTGLDTESIISRLMQIEQRPLLRLQTQQATLLTRKSAWNAVKSQLDSLTSKIDTLRQTVTFSGKTATASDASVLSATASADAVEGRYDILVTSLASAQAVQSKGFATIHESLNYSGAVTLNGQSIAISATDSLETVAAKINATSGIKASAAILQTGASEYKIVLTSSETGESGAMEFGGAIQTWKDLGFLVDVGGIDVANEVIAARDAAFAINGVQFTRSSNSVSDAIPGVTLTLSEARDASGDGGKSSLTVGYDDQAIISGARSFIADYNNLLDTVAKYTTWDADTRVAGPLFGDALVTNLVSQVRSAVIAEVASAGDTYNTLRSVGVGTGAVGSYSKDGKLTLDEAKLKEALKADRNAVAVLFGAKRANVALSPSATATASSTAGDQYPVSSVINGDTSSALWGAGGGWSDGTPGDFTGDWLEVDLGKARTIDTVNVYTVDSTQFPANLFGIKDFNLEYWTGSAWSSLGDPVAGNTAGVKALTFSAVTTQKIRLNVTGSNDGVSSRVVEVEAYAQDDGAFSRLDDIVDLYASADGFVSNRKLAIDAEDRSLATRIDDMQKRLDTREATLKAQYTALEVTLQKLNSQSAWLTQQFASLSRTTQ